nr:MAG TPA: hypothetical protein [Bacteriophage sp.]
MLSYIVLYIYYYYCSVAFLILTSTELGVVQLRS